MQFLSVLLRDPAETLRTAEIASEVGWLKDYGQTYGTDLGYMVAKKLHDDGFVEVWQERPNSPFLVRLKTGLL